MKTGLTLAICTYNRPKKITTLLKSVKAQSVLPDQIIIIEDISTHQFLNQKIVKKVVDNQIKISYIDVNFKNISQSRNLAMSQNKSPILVFADDDTVLPHNTFKKLKTLYQKHPYVLGFVGTITPTTSDYFSIASCFVMNNKLSKFAPVPFSTASLFSLKTNLLPPSIRFDPQLSSGEDIDFFIRLFINRTPIYFSPNLSIFHDFTSSPPFSRFVWHGKVAIQLSHKYPEYFNYLWCLPQRKLDYLLFPWHIIKTLLKLTKLVIKESKVPPLYWFHIFLTQCAYLYGIYQREP